MTDILRNNNILLYSALGIFIVAFLFYSEANQRANILVQENNNNIIAAERVAAVAASSEDPVILALATTEENEEVVEVEETPIEETAPTVEDEVIPTPAPTPEPEVTEQEEVEEVIEEVLEETQEVEEVISSIELPYFRTIFTEGSGWVLGYGAMRFQDENLIVGGGPFDAASLVLLENSENLTDYAVDVDFDWNKGGSVSLVSRFADYGNYTICQYLTNASQVSIINVVNGERISLASSPSLGVKNFEGWKDLNIGMSVNGNSVSCLKDGNVVLKADNVNMPEAGGFGISNWGRQGGDALSTVDIVRITAN